MLEKEQEMKRSRLLLTGAAMMLALGQFAATSRAATVTWSGQNWDDNYGGTVALNGSDLNVTTVAMTNSSWGAAHINTSSTFRTAPTQWVQASFIDAGGTGPGASIWLEHEAVPGAWTQAGAYEGDSNYSIYWWNEVTNADATITLGARTAGTHTIKIGKLADGTIEYSLDGVYVGSESGAPFGYLGDVYLAGNSALNNPGQTITFTDFQMGTNYVTAAVPLPAAAWASLMLLGALGGMAALKRRAHQLA